jgi:hypothetical protein
VSDVRAAGIPRWEFAHCLVSSEDASTYKREEGDDEDEWGVWRRKRREEIEELMSRRSLMALGED